MHAVCASQIRRLRQGGTAHHDLLALRTDAPFPPPLRQAPSAPLSPIATQLNSPCRYSETLATAARHHIRETNTSTAYQLLQPANMAARLEAIACTLHLQCAASPPSTMVTQETLDLVATTPSNDDGSQGARQTVSINLPHQGLARAWVPTLLCSAQKPMGYAQR